MMRSAAVALSFVFSALLTGCALTNTASSVEQQGMALQGHVHGGQQPVVGARVYLLAANTTGYPTATTNASKSLMKYVANVTSLDISSGPTNGFYYVTTDANGSFSISGDYSCTSGQQAYVYVVGGNPGAGTNTASGFLAVLGNCPTAGNYLASVPSLYINEVTTVASAYAMSGFAYDALHVSSPSSTQSKRYIQNAFANANNIIDITRGVPYSTLPAGNGSGAPNTINTLANVLAACVNSTGPASTNCATLFTLAKTNGSSGTVATDTATAAINIAHNQGTNVAALFGLLGATQAFVPSYTSATADFSLPIRFTSPELGAIRGIALDASGNVWLSTGVLSSYPTSVNGYSELSPQGVHLTTVTDTTNFTSAPSSLIVSAEGNVFGTIGLKYIEYVPGSAAATSFATGNNSSPYDITESGGALEYVGQYNGTNLLVVTGYGTPAGTGDTGFEILALDGLGDYWATNAGSMTLTGWNTNTNRITPSPGYSIGFYPSGLAIDQANSIWIGGGASSGQALKVNRTGTRLATYVDSNMNSGGSIYVDGANNVWFYGFGTDAFVELDAQGNQLQTFGRITASPDQRGVALDGSGNTWINSGSGGIYQLIGLTTPVVTPIASNFVSPYTTPASKPQ